MLFWNDWIRLSSKPFSLWHTFPIHTSTLPPLFVELVHSTHHSGYWQTGCTCSVPSTFLLFARVCMRGGGGAGRGQEEERLATAEGANPQMLYVFFFFLHGLCTRVCVLAAQTITWDRFVSYCTIRWRCQTTRIEGKLTGGTVKLVTRVWKRTTWK